MSQPDDFEIIHVLKNSIHGSTLVVRKKNDENRFVMKKIPKYNHTNIASNKHLLCDIHHSFLVKLYWLLTDAQNIYFITTYCSEWNLMKILQTEGDLSEPVTRFYMAQCANAINYLHSMDIIHTNLHPQNILISHNGYIKITDFYSLKYDSQINDTLTLYQNYNYHSKFNDNNTNEKYKNICKINKLRRSKHDFLAANYMSPQLFTTTNYTNYTNFTEANDWWSFGIILYECVIGYVPFYPTKFEYKWHNFKDLHLLIFGYIRIESNILNICIPMDIIPFIIHKVNDSIAFTHDTIKRIKNFRKTLRIPKQVVSKSCKDLIFRLLCSERRRLSYHKLKRHSWFKRVPWHNIQAMKPPWIPNKTDLICDEIATKNSCINGTESNFQSNFKFLGRLSLRGHIEATKSN